MLRGVSLVLVAVLCLFVPAIALGDSHDPKRIMADEVMDKLNAGEDILFLDTRTTQDWNAGSSMIRNAIRVKNNEHLKQIVMETPKERFIVTYCT